MGRTFHSSYSNYARRVSVLVSKSLLYTTRTVKIDPFGRFVILVLVIDNRPYTFLAVYIPPLVYNGDVGNGDDRGAPGGGGTYNSSRGPERSVVTSNRQVIN